MSWIKRNLYFLVGSVLALGLLGVSVVYMLGASARDNEVKEKLTTSYNTLKTLKEATPSPGSEKVNNIATGREQVALLQQYVRDARNTFAPIPGIPDGPRVEGQVFSAELHNTLKGLREQARAANNVTLPSTNYNFTFESIVRQVTFTQRGLAALARQLGEVKAISEILFAAKINGLEGFKRVRVAKEDDPSTNPADYLNESPKTNDFAVMVPYEVTIQCFSAELAAVLNGFANASNCIIVKSINVEPIAPSAAGGYGDAAPAFNPMVAAPVYAMPAPGVRPGGNPAMDARMRSRYGIGGPGGRGEGRFAAPAPAPSYYQPPPMYGAPQTAAATGPQDILSERAVRVTLRLVLPQLLGTDPERRRGR
jgi:hypothetical protein